MEVRVRIALRIHHGFAVLLVACQHAGPPPPYLPSHPISEMFPRASSPPPTCPGQYRIAMESYTGDVFMGCWGNKAD
jgi:hypothetical protein